MNPSAARLFGRVLAAQLVVTIVALAGLALGVPKLLLLPAPIASAVTRFLALAVAIAALAGVARTSFIVRRHRFVLRALTLGSRSVEPSDMTELVRLPWRATASWFVPLAAAAALLVTPARPAIVDLVTGASVALLSVVLIAALSLPLHIAIRAAALAALDLAPTDVMSEAVDIAARTGAPSRRLPRRILAAVASPVALVAFGSALITNAHLRRADESHREEAARSLARAALGAAPGVVEEAGVAEAIGRARNLGFYAKVLDHVEPYSHDRTDDGWVTVTAPLDRGTARVRFSGSTVSILSAEPLGVTLLGLVVAALAAAAVGLALNRDLRAATRGVRMLGTDAVIGGGTRMVQPARFRIVGDLGSAIERLAERFHVFARAQERSIEAREAATRTRGLFFASVSHDLKSPLNAILGFTDLVRQEPLTSEQVESLDLIHKRGRELLALIEAILDAARVEAGQLSLVHEEEELANLVWTAVDKGRDLGGERDTEVSVTVPEAMTPIRVDRVRVGRALATFIGHAMRTAERPPVRITAFARPDALVVEVEVPSTRNSREQLAAMLDPAGRGQPSASENRGLALGLGLARAVIELHGGRVAVVDRGPARPAFEVTLPRRSE